MPPYTWIIGGQLLQNVGIYSVLMAFLYRATPTGPRIKQSQLNHRPNKVAFYMYYKQEVLGIYSKPLFFIYKINIFYNLRSTNNMLYFDFPNSVL